MPPTAVRNPLAAVLRSLGSLIPGRRADGPAQNRIIRPWSDDAHHQYPTVGLTPSKLLALLQSADFGAPTLQFELFSDMLQRWPRLAAVENTRRLALTGLDWEVLPASGTDNNNAQAAVDYVRQTLDRIDRFRDALDHLANAIGFGIGLAELVWDAGELIDVVPVPYNRLIVDPNEPWRVRVRTEDEPTRGVPIDDQPLKWLVHQPRPKPGRPFSQGLLRASALLYLAQNLSFKDWLIFSQIAGMPVRVAQFEPGTPDADKRDLLKMLESLGTDAVAAFGKNIDLKFIETSNSGQRPYQPLQEYCNTEVTILWLGQHLTTDIRQSGSRAAAEIHDRVREDLLVNDIADESRTIRRDLIRPLVQAHFGDDVPVPVFRRSLVQAVDTRVLADVLAVAVNQLGLQVPTSWVHQALGIPAAKADEATVPGEVTA